jgi:L-amino acid N-acyltransferase YncA
MDFLVRKARETDAEAIIELLNPIIREGKYTVLDSPFAVNDQVEFIRSFPGRGAYNVAVRSDDRRVLGIQDIQPASAKAGAFAHIGEISTFVRLDSQRLGVGSLLTRETLQDAERLGFRKISATVRADNPVAVCFYISQGFRVVGTARKHALVSGRYIDEVLLERLLL